MDSLSVDDLQVLREKSRAFCGSFRIPLDKLEHEDLPNNPRQRDGKNVARLLNIFRAEGCQRRELENHVPALISRSALPSPHSGGGVFEEPQCFVPKAPLRILHGRHRLEAACRFLEGNDKWWIVDLYSDDLNSTVKTELREQTPNSSKWFDGDIVRQIRISTIDGDFLPSAINLKREKWLARLSKSKRKCLLRLEALSDEFIESLDRLIPFAGLWTPFQIGTFPRILNLHCPEEMTRYMCRVNKTWTHIMGTRETDQLQLDANTVVILQGRCPFRSKEDHAFVRARMLVHDIFPSVRDDYQRSEIFHRICSVEHVIPSMYTCVEDTKWLEPGARIMKELLPKNRKGSLSQEFRALHNGKADIEVQTDEFSFEHRDSPSGNSFWISFRQLFLFCLRHFPVMDRQVPRKDVGKQSGSHTQMQHRWWHELSVLASKSGYSGLRQKYPDRRAADTKSVEDCVRSILPSKYYKIDPARMRRIIQLNCQLMRDVPYVERMKLAPNLTSDDDDCGSDITDRCGRPREHSFQTDEENLFLDQIYYKSFSTLSKRYLTSFCVKRDCFHSFFGSEEDGIIPCTHPKELKDGVVVNEKLDVHMPDRDLVELQTAGQHLLTSGNQPTTKEEGEQSHLSEPQRPTAIFGHGISQHLLTSGNQPTTKEEGEQSHLSEPQRPTAIFGHGISQHLSTSGNQPTTKEEGEQSHLSEPQRPMAIFGHDISLQEATRLLNATPKQTLRHLFTVLSPVADNRFRKRQVNSLDTSSIIAALDLPSQSRYIARDKHKRLKLTAPIKVLEAAQSKQLHTVVKVLQPSVQTLVRRFENENNETDEELDEIY